MAYEDIKKIIEDEVEKRLESGVTKILENRDDISLFGVPVTPFHIHNGVDSPLLDFIGLHDVQHSYAGEAGSVVTVNSTETGVDFEDPDLLITRYILYRVLAPTSTDAVGTTVGGDLVMPFTGTLTSVGATVDTAGTTGTTQFDINKNTTTILSTKITIDSTEKTSRTAATPPVISVSTFTTGDILTFDIDTVQTTPALGLTFFLVATQTS